MKSFFITIVTVLFLTSCSDNQDSLDKMRQEIKIEQENFRKNTEVIGHHRRLDQQRDSMINAKLQENLENLKDSVQIIKSYTSLPNSVGGVDLHIIWKNKTKRVVKYANFQVSAVNAVGDEVFSEIRQGGIAVATGPFKSNSVNGYGTYWGCMWYNSTIKKCIIQSVELEFFDGTSLQIKL